MSYLFNQKVLFRHCDPAGIVFYPRYFEMINDTVEAFFDDVVDTPFHRMHEKNAVPTARIECKFTAPSYQGDQLVISLDCEKIGRSSLDISILANCAEELRFKCELTIVYVNEAGRPTSWTNDMREKLEALIGKVSNAK